MLPCGNVSFVIVKCSPHFEVVAGLLGWAMSPKIVVKICLDNFANKSEVHVD